jgi:hypothetical protein
VDLFPALENGFIERDRHLWARLSMTNFAPHILYHHDQSAQTAFVGPSPSSAGRKAGFPDAFVSENFIAA